MSPLPQPVQGIHRWRDVPNPLRPNLTLTLPNPGGSAVRKKPKASGKGRLGGPWKVMSHWEAMPPVTFHLCSNGRFLGAKRALLVSVGARGEHRGGFITSNPWWDKGLPPLTLRGGPTLLVANSRVWESYGVSVSRCLEVRVTHDVTRSVSSLPLVNPLTSPARCRLC